MAIKRYTKMAYAKPDDMVFGIAKSPVSYGFGIKVGAGRVIPEINYAPRPGREATPEKLTKEYVDYISKDAIERAVTEGFPDLQLETEWVFQMGNNSDKFGRPVVEGQKAICEEMHEKYGINLAVRHTIPDMREAERGMRPGMDKERSYPEKVLESAEIACEAGADVLSCETVGGKEVLDYAVMTGDIKAALFGIGVLGSMDMEWIWQEFVKIAKKHKTVPGGDTNCSGANVAMFMAGGFLDNDVPKTFSAVTRTFAAVRTLCAWEAGAVGPDKDCGYEGPILKAIAGKPTSQEGKNCECAHADLQGNLMAQVCDLWSNESIEYHPEFGGSSVACWLGSLGYEVSLMNTALLLGQEKTLRDLYMYSDRFRGPEGFILAYDNAYKIGEAIVAEDNVYLRAKAAGLTAAKLIDEAYSNGTLQLTISQKDMLKNILKVLSSLPDDENKFIEDCVKQYSAEIPAFNPKNYEL